MGGEEERRSERWEIREERGKGEGYERGRREGEGENIGKDKLVLWMKAGAFLLSTCTT